MLAFISSISAQSFSAARHFNPKDFKQNTSVYGQVEHSTDPTASISYYKNNISYKKEILELPIMKDGSFGVELHLRESAVLDFTYFGKTVQFYLEPGDDLELSFNGESFPKSIAVEGRGKEKNEYFLAHQNKFEKYNSHYLQYKIGLLDPFAFQDLLNEIKQEKLDFLNGYDLAKKRKFTPEFKQYLSNENMYWWALQLLSYRLEKPLMEGGPVPMDLPDSYYSFLNDIPISNNDALKNKSYTDFLEEFLQFKGESVQAFEEIPFKQTELNIGKTFIEESSGEESKLPLGTLVNILDDQNKISVAFKNQSHAHFSIDDMMYIGLPDGKKGWISKHGIHKTNNDKIEKYAVARFHNLHLIKDPLDENQTVGKLGKGEELTYLHLKTSENHMYTHHGVPYWDLLCKVKKSNGIEGWVSESTLEFRERRIRDMNDKGQFLYSLTDASESRKFLEGEPLFYTLAKALFWKMQIEDLSSLARDIAVYDENNPFEKFDKILRAEHNVAQLKIKAKNNYVENYAYNNIMNPNIKGVEMALPFDDSQIYVSNNLKKKESSIKKFLDIPVINPSATASKTYIRGNVKNNFSAPLELRILYDGISYKESVYVINEDHRDKFNLDLELTYPVYAYMQKGESMFEFYIFPGDEIDLSVDASKLDNSSIVSGTRKKLHDFIKIQNQFLKSYQSRLKEAERGKDFLAFAKLLKDYEKKSILKLEKYSKKQSLSIQDEDFAKANVQFAVASRLFNFIDKYEIKLAKRYDFVKTINPSQDGMLNNMNYLNFLDSYFNYLRTLPEHRLTNKYELADQYLVGESQTYLKAKELAIKCKIGQSYDYASKIKSFLDVSENGQANQALSIIYNETKDLNAGSLAPGFSLADIDGKTVELSDFKGKVVFIDFWATWCRPCLKALHYSQEMKEFYADKEVVFLYVSMDEDPQMWNSYVRNNSLKGVHVNVKNTLGMSSDIAKLYKIRKIPAFVLIDQEGKIAFPKAASPGSNLLYNQINGLLKNPKF